MESEDAPALIAEQPGEPVGGGAVEGAGQKIVGALVKSNQQRYRDAAEAIDDWRRDRKERNPTLGGEITIRELIEEGRDRRFAWLLGSADDEDDRGERGGCVVRSGPARSREG